MNDALNHPHDKFIKEVLTDKDNVRDFFLHYFPEHIRRLVNLDSLEICKDSFIEKELKEYFSDLLYRINLSEDQGEQQEGYLHLLFEHKSSPEKWIAFHLLRYQVKIWEQFLKQNAKAQSLPVIIPLVLYHGLEKWKIGRQLSDLVSSPKEELKAYIPDFSYHLYDLSAYSADQIQGMITLRVSLLLLKYIHHPELPKYLKQIFPLLKGLFSKERKGLHFFESVIRYIFNATDKVSVEELKEIVDESIAKDKRISL